VNLSARGFVFGNNEMRVSLLGFGLHRTLEIPWCRGNLYTRIEDVGMENHITLHDKYLFSLRSKKRLSQDQGAPPMSKD
jgi:hypothetical protein